MRSFLKHSAETLLCRSGVARAGRVYWRRGTVVLAYHNIVPDGEPYSGDGSLHLPQREFARQLDLLGRTHQVIPLDQLFAPPGADRPRVVITFDDAYQGAMTAGVAELVSRGMPATVFVAPRLLEGKSFWWDVLAEPGRGLSPAVRLQGLERLRGYDGEIRRWALEHGLPLSEVPTHQRGATQAQLSDAVCAGGITLASHTWSHPNLAALSGAELDSELTRPLYWLRERFAGVLPWLAYPYGLSSPAVEEAARRAGYSGAFRVDGGWMPTRETARQTHAFPRTNIPAGASLHAFELRISGLLNK